MKRASPIGPAAWPRLCAFHTFSLRVCVRRCLDADRVSTQVASGAGRHCVYRTMNTLNICEPGEPKTTCWLRQAVIALLGLAALLLLVTSFAVEVMATGADLHQRAQSSLGATQAMSGLD